MICYDMIKLPPNPQLGTSYNLCLQLPEQDQIIYKPWDFKRVAKQSRTRILVRMMPTIAKSVEMTGLFVCAPPGAVSMPQDNQTTPKVDRFPPAEMAFLAVSECPPDKVIKYASTCAQVSQEGNLLQRQCIMQPGVLLVWIAA